MSAVFIVFIRSSFPISAASLQAGEYPFKEHRHISPSTVLVYYEMNWGENGSKNFRNLRKSPQDCYERNLERKWAKTGKKTIYYCILHSKILQLKAFTIFGALERFTKLQNSIKNCDRMK
jgi:hypothetical protein